MHQWKSNISLVYSMEGKNRDNRELIIQSPYIKNHIRPFKDNSSFHSQHKL